MAPNTHPEVLGPAPTASAVTATTVELSAPRENATATSTSTTTTSAVPIAPPPPPPAHPNRIRSAKWVVKSTRLDRSGWISAASASVW
jgi:hypothetical protein